VSQNKETLKIVLETRNAVVARHLFSISNAIFKKYLPQIYLALQRWTDTPTAPPTALFSEKHKNDFNKMTSIRSVANRDHDGSFSMAWGTAIFLKKHLLATKWRIHVSMW
jgi:hypothetical protein